MNYKLAIFDMDGTILNTLEDLTDCINYATAANGYPTHSIDEVRQFVGNGLYVLVDKACPAGVGSEEKQKVFHAFKEHYKLHNTDKTRPYDGICGLLDELKRAGCLTAVVSNKQHAAVLDLCNMYFDGLFDYALGERPEIPRKPNPDPVYHVLNELGIDKRDAVYIGDSDVDFTTAKNAGTDLIMVTWGFRDKEFLKSLGATVFADTTDEIKKIILD